MSINWQANRSLGLQGEFSVPGDKSISHRAIMMAALAEGVSTIEGFLEGEDTRATARIFAQLLNFDSVWRTFIYQLVQSLNSHSIYLKTK